MFAAKRMINTSQKARKRVKLIKIINKSKRLVLMISNLLNRYPDDGVLWMWSKMSCLLLRY